MSAPATCSLQSFQVVLSLPLVSFFTCIDFQGSVCYSLLSDYLCYELLVLLVLTAAFSLAQKTHKDFSSILSPCTLHVSGNSFGAANWHNNLFQGLLLFIAWCTISWNLFYYCLYFWVISSEKIIQALLLHLGCNWKRNLCLLNAALMFKNSPKRVVSNLSVRLAIKLTNSLTTPFSKNMWY